MNHNLKPIYLDYNATTPIDPKVFESMLPYLRNDFGNPSSSHVYGRIPKEALERAREQVAALIGVSNIDEIILLAEGQRAITTQL